MMKSIIGNRLSSGWRCPHCKSEVDARTFWLDPADANGLLCPDRVSGKSFEWKLTEHGKLWPEQHAYNVLQ